MRLFAILLLATLVPGVAGAHSYAPITDAALAARAELIVSGRVTVAAAVIFRGTPYTEYTVEVDEHLLRPGPATVRVRVAGGSYGDGSMLLSTSSPVFVVGESVILFLTAGEDGSFRVADGRLGAFHITGSGPGAIASRALAPATANAPHPQGVPWRGDRDARGFSRWLRAGTRDGFSAPPQYFLPPADRPAAVVLPFSLLQAQGRAARWPELDVDFGTTGALPGIDGGGMAESLTAAAAWSQESGLSLNVQADAGGTSGQNADGVNSIFLQDPDNHINGSFDCNDGGTLGETRARILLEPHEVDGETFFTLIEADVVLQDGIECWLDRTLSGAEELIGHELGHAVGIDHSEILDALMFASAHGDGRGATIHDDDIAALRALRYGEPSEEDPEDEELPRLRKPRGQRPRGSTTLPLTLRFRTRDAGAASDGPIQLYELEIRERGADEPLIMRTLRFGRDLGESCGRAGSTCEVLLDQRAVTSKFELGGRYVWRIRASQGAGDVENNFSPWSNRRNFRIRR